MNRITVTYLIFQLIFTFGSCEINVEEKDRLVNAFVDFYNKLPDHIYVCEEGYLQNAQQFEPYKYQIEVSIRVSEYRNVDAVKYLNCTATLAGADGTPVTVLTHNCVDEQPTGDRAGEIEENPVREGLRGPVALDNEIQLNTAVTSGEQFIAVPREEPKVECTGCSSHVDPKAKGVDDLANIGIRQLNSLEPQIKHSLNSVVDVERQVQVVNGVRYILTFQVNYNSCPSEADDSCVVVKPCKISILEKPWLKLPDGSKYRAIISNNCTEQWQFGDNGVVVTDTPANHPVTDGGTEDTIKSVHYVPVKSERPTPNPLTDEDIKNIEEQIIPRSQVSSANSEASVKNVPNTEDAVNTQEHVNKEKAAQSQTANSIPAVKRKVEPLSDDKKQAIDELLNFFSFTGVDDLANQDVLARPKRSYNTDLHVMEVAEKYHKLRKNLENAKQVYTLAQLVVDYQNEIDLEIKNRVLKEVINAEEEVENHQHYFYIQYRVVIPCNKADCEEGDTVTRICNTVIDSSTKFTKILNIFCHEDEKQKLFGKIRSVALDDPVLMHLVKEALHKIEIESSGNALKLNRVVDAYTQLESGTVTKVSVIFDYTECDITIPAYLRDNCTVSEELGLKICEVIIHERHWLKEKKISYTCNDKSIDVSFPESQKRIANKSVEDPAIKAMVQEAIQYLEVQSNKNNKQVLVRINSVSTKLVSGFLTDIEFIVGYTTCANDIKVDDISKCKLLDNEPLRKCKAKVWDRTWIENGRQVDVSCLDSDLNNNEGTRIRKRSLLSISSNADQNDEADNESPQIVDICDGCFVEQDKNKPKYKKLAEESMQKYLQESGNSIPHKVVSVNNVSTQVVAGSLTRIDFVISPETATSGDAIQCHSEVWEKPWEHFKQIRVNCQIYDNSANMREKRQSAGLPLEKDPKDPKYKQLAEESMQKYLQESGNSVPHKVVSVNNVSTQVVAGSLTKIDFVISPVTGTTGDVIRCHSEVWEKLWDNFKKITVNCQIDDNAAGKREKRSLTGGIKVVDSKDPKYTQLAEESMQKYLQDSGISQPHKVVSVNHASIQVVAGTLTRIDFVISPETATSGDAIQCHSEVWEKPWEHFKQIRVNCQIYDNSANMREKRQSAGLPLEKDPKDPKYKQLAEESMQKYLQESGNSVPHKVVSVNNVSTQVVAGSLTKIDFVISPVTGTTGDVIRCHSEVWEKLWDNFKKITVNCQIDDNAAGKREKRSLTGGIKVVDSKDPKYTQLAEESMQKYLQDSGISQPHKVVSVNHASIQVVAGTLTRIDFVISPETATSGDAIQCHSEVWEKPWEHFKQIRVNCQIYDNSANMREKRQSAGGPLEKDPKDPKYKQLAEESMQKYLQESGNSVPHKVVSVNNVSTQVVAGSLTKIDFVISPVTGTTGDVIRCHSEVWEKLWDNFKKITVNCQIDDNAAGKREKRSITGGIKVVDPKDPKYTQLAEESMQKYLQDSGISQPHKVVSVNHASIQVVAGTLTRIDFVIFPETATSGDAIQCHSEVWEKPWEHFKQIRVNCQIYDNSANMREKRQSAGLPLEKDPKDPKYKQLAEESMQKYLQESGNSVPHKVVSVNNVSTQVVAGSLTKIDFVISPVMGTTGDVIRCHSEVWEKLWDNFKKITVNCQIDDNAAGKREKRSLTGGIKVVDPKDLKYTQLAEESMQKYLQDSGISQPHKVVSVNHASIQVVAGTLTRIDFVISPETATSGDAIQCHSEVWEKPWEHFKKITVNCQIDKRSSKRSHHTKREVINIKTNVENKRPKANHISGGEVEQDPTKTEYIELAEKSLKKYLKLQNIRDRHNVIEIKKITSQVVSGVLYKLDFTACPASAGNNCEESLLLKCHSEVWSQPWLHKNEITVSCRNKNNKRKARSEKADNLVDDVNGKEERRKRQADEEDYLDDDIKFYYADRAIEKLNDQSTSKNLFKLITVHAIQNTKQMGAPMVRMYIEAAETFCMRFRDEKSLPNCEELDGMNHKLCLVRLWPAPDDELVIQSVSVVCDDDPRFETISGLSIPVLLKVSIAELENSPDVRYKLVHQGEPHIIPSLDSNLPITVNFVVATTNCTKDVTSPRMYDCFVDITKPSQACRSFIWLIPNSRNINRISAQCHKTKTRKKRSISTNPTNATADELIIQNLVKESLQKLEMASANKYKQRVLRINSYTTKITSGKVTTIDFDVGYTTCLKYEWVKNEKSCEFIEHLPRKHCVSQVWERLWIDNGRNIEVSCEDEETPLEAHVEFENVEVAKGLANEVLKHIEAKYPHPRKQQVVRIFSLEKQVVAGIHYRLKLEVGFTNCTALSNQKHCKFVKGHGVHRFCRANVWLRPWTEHPPNYRVTCDYQEGGTADFYHHIQAEQLFHEFLTTYKPEYINDHKQIMKRFEIFKDNVRKIHEFNTHERGTATYGVTRFADLSYEEFSSKFLGLKPNLRNPNHVPMRQAQIPKLAIPDKFDWREYGAVTEVKNQGSCGSCWAFSVTGNIEGQWKMHTGDLVSLSEQELVDCDTLDTGCNGGLPDNAYRAIEELGGLETEADYPYEGEDDKCSFNKTLSKVTISGAVNITSNETDMAKWLVTHGPISIGINANAMQFYMGGVSHPWKMLCNPNNLDHGVLIVGYGIKQYPLFHKELPYWTIKNSWGKSWGEQGYYRVYRGDGTCGVNMMASSAVI